MIAHSAADYKRRKGFIWKRNIDNRRPRIYNSICKTKPNTPLMLNGYNKLLISEGADVRFVSGAPAGIFYSDAKTLEIGVR